MFPRPPSFSGRARQEWLLLGAVLFAVGLFGLWSRLVEHREIDAGQRHLLAVQAKAVDDALTGQFLAIGTTLRNIRDAHARWGPEERAQRLPARVQAVAEAMPWVSTVTLADRDGRVWASSEAALVGSSLAEAGSFRQARARTRADSQQLTLSGPIATPSGDYTADLTLLLATTDVAFDGVVIAKLDTAHVRAVLHATLYADDVWAAAGHADGTLLLMEPPRPGTAGFKLDLPGSFFRRHRESGQRATVMTGRVASTGENRLMAQRTVDAAAAGLDRPLVIAVGRNLDTMFMPWWRQTATVALMYGLLVICAVVALIAMQRRQRALEALQARQEEAERQGARRLELALRGADLGLWDLDLSSGQSHVSERWNSMLGLPHQPVYPDSECWTSRVHPEDFPRVWAAQQAHLDGQTERFEEAYRMRHADGHWLWVLDRAQVLERDAQGAPLRMVGTHMDTTEAMEARLAIERSEQNLSTTLHSIGDAVIATDPEGRLVRINAAAERLTGWPAAEAIGQPLGAVFRIFHARTRAPSIDPVRQVLERGEVVGLANDTLLRSRDGSEYQIADSAAPIRTLGGEVTGVVLVFSDVTERYRVEQALRANEERLRSLLDHLGSGVIVHAADTRIIDANPSACRISGLPLDKLRGRHSSDPHWTLLEEDGSVMAHEHYPAQQVLACDGPVSNIELGVHHPGRPPQWVLVNAYPTRDADGRIAQIVVTFSDITARREAEAELRLLAASVARLNDVVLITEAEPLDAPGPRIVFVNPAFERLTGWTREEAIGQSPRILQGPKTDTAELARIGQAVRRGEPVHAELINYTRGGAEYWVEFDIIPLTDRLGRTRHLVAIQRDITERKQAERDRLTLERQLREAQKMESIGTLAGGIAHDFNNILAAILGNVAMAREDLPSGHPAAVSLDQIHRAGLRARHLVQQILTFSRRDQRGLTIQPLGPVIDETLDLLRATLPAGVRIDTVRPADSVLVRGDSTQLQQVLVNLCTNAWHALPESGGRIEVGLDASACDAALLHRLPELKPGHCAHLWVRDNGSGMDEATRARIFDPFFTTKPIGQGTGLGLSVVHGIVRAHGGVIAVDTAPGEGTTVHLYFPIPEPEDSDAARVHPVLAAPAGAGQHVLYIDDDEVMVVTVERLLQRAGFAVTVDTDPAAAIERVRQNPAAFDAVVTDFNMPELSGLDVARQLARIRADLPVVISSGYLSEDLRSRAAEAGVRHLLQKENSFEELGGLLLRLFGARPT